MMVGSKKLLIGKLGTDRVLDFGRMRKPLILTLNHYFLDSTSFLWTKERR